MRRALAFLTPLGSALPPAPAALAWFPLVGVGLGLALGTTWWLAAEAWPLAVAAAIVVVGDLALTGMLHLDGLVDSADGLLPPVPADGSGGGAPARRLAMMADPSAGAFGVGAAVCVLLLRWTALATLRPSVLLLGGLWCASRTTMAAAVRAIPYARPGGLAEVFRGAKSPPVAVVAAGMAGAGALGWAAAGVGGAVSIMAVVAAGSAVLALGRYRLGGFTGDVLGAAGLVGETAGLLVVAARW